MTEQHTAPINEATASRRSLFRGAGVLGAAAVAGLATPAIVSTAFPQAANAAWVSGWNYDISREEALDRAFFWVNNPRAYSMNNSSMGPEQDSSVLWRTDCSGFVSMALGIRNSDNPTGLTTETLHPDGGYGISSAVSRSNLLPGDFLILRNADSSSGIGHVVLFNGWASDSTYYAAEQTTPQTTNQTRNYANDVANGYAPFRYTNIYGS